MARGQLVQVCVCVFGCCEMYKFRLVALKKKKKKHTPARNKTKKERKKKKKG